MNKASFRNMHSLDFIHHHKLKIKIKPNFSQKWQTAVLGQKNKGHIYCTGSKDILNFQAPQSFSHWPNAESITHKHIGLTQKALHTKVKHLGVMQYHMLDLLTDEIQYLLSANPTGLTQIKCHILFHMIQKHFRNKYRCQHISASSSEA